MATRSLLINFNEDKSHIFQNTGFTNFFDLTLSEVESYKKMISQYNDIYIYGANKLFGVGDRKPLNSTMELYESVQQILFMFLDVSQTDLDIDDIEYPNIFDATFLFTPEEWSAYESNFLYFDYKSLLKNNYRVIESLNTIDDFLLAVSNTYFYVINAF